MAGGHQIVLVQNGTPYVSLGSNIWTAGTVTASGGNSSNWNAAYTHVSSTGADHSYINQSVTTAAGPTFAGLNMTGSVDMNANNVNYVSQLHFNDNVRFYDDGNNNYLNFRYGSTGAGGIKIYDGELTPQLQGYLYASGSQAFGLLDGDGNWSYLTQKDSYTAFLINNSEKIRIESGGNVGIGTNSPEVSLQVGDSLGSYSDKRIAIGNASGASSLTLERRRK